jgi:hypothetical protein
MLGAPPLVLPRVGVSPVARVGGVKADGPGRGPVCWVLRPQLSRRDA